MKNWMEKAASPSTTHSMESCGDLQCVGTLEIVRPKPVGFLCGSIPVPTDNSFHSFNSSALLPSTQTVSAPRYRILPTEPYLNALPVVSNLPDKVLPIVAAQSKPAGVHSVRMEACDCPPTHHALSEGQSNSSFLPGATMSPFVGNSDEVTSDGAFSQSLDYAQLKQEEIFWKKKKSRNKGHHLIKKASHVGEAPLLNARV